MSFNVIYAVNNKTNITSQNTLTVSKMAFSEVVDTSSDLIEETNIDIELLIVVRNVTIRLNKKVTFSDMCKLLMKDLLIVMSIVTIRLNKKANFSNIIINMFL